MANDTQRFLGLEGNAVPSSTSVELWEDDGIRDPSRLNAAVTGSGHVHVMRVEWQIGYYYRFDVRPDEVHDVFRAIGNVDLLHVPPMTDPVGSRSFPIRIVLVRNERREIVSASDRESPAFAECHARLRVLVDPLSRKVAPYKQGGPWFPGCVTFP